MPRPLDPVQVREARPCDRGAIATLLRERWGKTVASRGRVHLLETLPALIAELEGRLAGCLTYHLEGDALEVVTLDALVERRGIGTALMHAVRPRARRIWLITTNDNLPAQAFYLNLGMTLAAVHEGAVAEARRLKPEIPLTGIGGVPIRDELEYQWSVAAMDGTHGGPA